jgi:hypothetical protein
MTAIPIQQHGHVPSAIMPAHFMQKCLKVFRALTLPRQKQPMTRR